MGRKYEGLDARKVTFRLDADMDSMLSEYMERTGHSMSDAIREALRVFSDYKDLSDVIKYVICNLEAVAETFDRKEWDKWGACQLEKEETPSAN